ncbi:MAG: hypothetical protein ACI9JN_000981 [Bacteroidia bacterium]|jgi:hypothetical protein
MLYVSLPQAKNKKEVGAGFFIKTSFHHNDLKFLNHLELVVRSTPELEKYYEPNIFFLPAKIDVDGPPPSEEEMLKLITNQHVKFSVAGRC